MSSGFHVFSFDDAVRLDVFHTPVFILCWFVKFPIRILVVSFKRLHQTKLFLPSNFLYKMGRCKIAK